MTVTLILVCAVILLAVFFTYTNGFQDGSSVAAGAIASRAMAPMQAIVLVCVFEFAGAVLGGSAVSGTIQAITNWPARTDLLPVLISGLTAAIAWNFLTRALKIPSSSTHALVGGVLGALFAAGGTKYFVWGHFDLFHPTGICKVISTLFVAPLAGFLAGFIALELSVLVLMRASMKVNKYLRGAQWITTATLAFAHGANDPQKAMGIIMLALHAANRVHGNDIPLWARVVTGVFISAGVASLSQGIVRRVGTGIYKLRTLQALAEELGSATVVLFGSLTGGPVSASQVISSSVMGVGTASRVKGVHWLVAKDMLMAWFLTIPCSAFLSLALHFFVVRWLNNLL